MSHYSKLCSLLAIAVFAAGCGLGGSQDASNSTKSSPNQGYVPALETKCFTTGPEFTLPTSVTAEGGREVPAKFIAADVSSAKTCEFVIQVEGMADSTAIVGELFANFTGEKSFEDFVQIARKNLTLGQEADILALGRLNSGASGSDLPIISTTELTEPNKAIVWTHDSDRNRGSVANTAVVEVPTTNTETQVIVLWGYSNTTNDKLIVDLINAMQLKELK